MELSDNSTLTDVVNSALVQIGDTPIKSITDDNDGKAVSARHLFEQAAREVQCHHSACWEELIREEILSMKGTPTSNPAFGDYIYNMPLQWLSINGVFSESGKYIGWRVFHNELHTKERAKHIRYVKYSDDPTEWSAELKSCIIELLAAKLLGAVVKDFSASRQMVENFWSVSFPRWVNNRAANAQRGKRGYEHEFSRYYFGNERVPPLTNTAEY